MLPYIAIENDFSCYSFYFEKDLLKKIEKTGFSTPFCPRKLKSTQKVI